MLVYRRVTNLEVGGQFHQRNLEIFPPVTSNFGIGSTLFVHLLKGDKDGNIELVK